MAIHVAQKTEIKVGGYGIKPGLAPHSLQRNAYVMQQVSNLKGSLRACTYNCGDYLSNSNASTSTADTISEGNRSRCSSGGFDTASAKAIQSAMLFSGKPVQAAAPRMPLMSGEGTKSGYFVGQGMVRCPSPTKFLPRASPTPARSAVAPDSLGRAQPQQQASGACDAPSKRLHERSSLSLPIPRPLVSPASKTPKPSISQKISERAASAVDLKTATIRTARRTEEPINVAMHEATVMTVEELKTTSSVFDPCQPQQRLQLLRKLGLSESAVIEKLEDNCGSFNDGIWSVSETNALGYVLKLVPAQRAHLHRTTDTEKYLKVQSQCPNIVSELSMSFPLKIFQLKGPSGATVSDLIVMRKAPGQQLTFQMVCAIKHGGSVPAMLDVMGKFGRFLKKIHRDYKGMQHGDCQASNIFYDEDSGQFTLIDVADFGYDPKMAQGGDNDVECFIAGLRTLSRWYGQSIIEDCLQRFQAGYNEL